MNTPDAVADQYDVLLAQLRNAPPLDPGSPTGTEPPGPTPTVPALCSGAPNSIYSLNVAEGWKAGVVLSRLSAPRAVVVDSKNNLIVLQRDIGITGHTLDANGCVTSTKIIIEDATFNHGLDVVGNKLYVRYGLDIIGGLSSGFTDLVLPLSVHLTSLGLGTTTLIP